MGHLYHGCVSHNQMVFFHTWLSLGHVKNEGSTTQHELRQASTRELNINLMDCKVLPQFGIAKLVNITLISLWFMVHISILTLVYKPTNITGGGTTLWEHHLGKPTEGWEWKISCRIMYIARWHAKKCQNFLGSVHIYPLSPIKTTARDEFVAMPRFDQLHQKQLHPEKKWGKPTSEQIHIILDIYIYICVKNDFLGW